MVLVGFAFTANAGNGDDAIFLHMGKDIFNSLSKDFKERFKVYEKNEEKVLLETDRDALPWISQLIHRRFQQCGGFQTYFDKKEAVEDFHKKVVFLKAANEVELYGLNQEKNVLQMMPDVVSENIKETIVKLSSYHNRYYDAQTGVDAVTWIKNHWEDLIQSRSDAKVEFFNHSRWAQPSVILTIEGSSKKDEIVVVGGHADSIAGFWGRSTARAPGADDNASGIATMTETIRVLVKNNFKPERTVKFMAYAAEEVGLLGSKEIAKSFKKADKNVIGALQLDMTNFNGSEQEIVMMSDFTDAGQNRFIGSLLSKYQKNVSWGYDKCGYACSDHASWHQQGYPASMPFEATKSKMNKKIHTAGDTISVSGDNAIHAAKFARLAVSYVAELSN